MKHVGELQAQVDAQLLERGAFDVLEFLLDSGRLLSTDVDDWRRREIDSLDAVLMGSKEKIQLQIEAAGAYARSIGLVQQVQTFYAWPSGAGERAEPLLISADSRLQTLIASRYVRLQDAPQMDLFFDSPVVALTNGIVHALATGNVGESQRQLDLLYAQAPNHADLAAFDRLLTAVGHLDRRVDEPRQELGFLLEVTPTARRLLGAQARGLLGPLWRQLATALEGRAFSSDEPHLHRSFALSEAEDWPGVSVSVRAETEWWSQVPLCLRLAQSSFHQQQRIEALKAWFPVFWRAPAAAANALEERGQPDTGITSLWQRFIDDEEDLSPVDFPAWLLLQEPGLTLQLPEALLAGESTGEAHYRNVHRWIQARRANRPTDEMTLRKTLQAQRPTLFRVLLRSVKAL